MDQDLQSIQQARTLIRQARDAQHQYKTFSQEQVDRIVQAMVDAGAAEAERLGQLAHDETGFGRPESKTQKNLFATRMLQERMRDMKTCGIIRKRENGTLWDIATPMGVVAALVPSTNPTSTAFYKAIIAAKARCGIVMSPHPRATRCTAEATRVVAEAAVRAGAPEGLIACMTQVSLAGTNELMENEHTDVILATGGGAMVRAAYSKGKPAYGVGSGNVPVYVDRTADLNKAAADIVYGASFDWGTLCSTERSIVADMPIRGKLLDALRSEGAYLLNDTERDQLRRFLIHKGGLNIEQVGQSPNRIAQMAGFSAPDGTRALVAEVDTVGKAEPLSMETLSPILAFYTADGWQAGCERCKEVLRFGGIGHTLGLHAQSDRIIEAFALEKPAMRIVVNTVCALGSVGYTTALFPAMTLGPGTIGGSITSDNISPLHLLNVKRLAFETAPINAPENGRATHATAPYTGNPTTRTASTSGTTPGGKEKSWMATIEERLLARAGNTTPIDNPAPGAPDAKIGAASPLPAYTKPAAPAHTSGDTGTKTSGNTAGAGLSETQIEQLVARFRK